MALENGENFLKASHQDCHYYEQRHGPAKGAEAGEDTGEEYLNTQEIYN